MDYWLLTKVIPFERQFDKTTTRAHYTLQYGFIPCACFIFDVTFKTDFLVTKGLHSLVMIPVAQHLPLVILPLLKEAGYTVMIFVRAFDSIQNQWTLRPAADKIPIQNNKSFIIWYNIINYNESSIYTAIDQILRYYRFNTSAGMSGPPWW